MAPIVAGYAGVAPCSPSRFASTAIQYSGRRLASPLGRTPSIRLLGQLAPYIRLDSDNELVTAIAVRLEHRCFAFADVEPVLAKRIHDVRLVRYDHNVAAGRWLHADELAKGLCASIVLHWRHHETAFSDVRRRHNFAEAQQCAGVDRPLEHAGLNLRDGNLELVHRLANRFCKRAAVVVELALLGDVLRIEGVGVGLI